MSRIAWMVERSNKGRVEYLALAGKEIRWVISHELGLEFVRDIDAIAAITFFDLKEAKAVEHMWVDD